MSTSPSFPRYGTYAITQDLPDGRERLYERVEKVVRGGVVAVQYRAKQGRATDEEALNLLSICSAYGVPLIINDDPSRALRVGAHGVHLGGSDPDIATAREILGPRAILGVSCYDRVEHALEAERLGADYVAFGRFFPSKTKPEASCADPSVLQLAKKMLSIPIVAIGGITPENGKLLIDHGAGLLAVIEGLFATADPESQASTFKALWNTNDQSQFRAPPV